MSVAYLNENMILWEYVNDILMDIDISYTKPHIFTTSRTSLETFGEI